MFETGEDKRNSYNYRDKYIKHHPGFFNSFYVCSQCFKPISIEELEVDHIFPISRWWAPNHLVNLVSTCRTCNRSKSDKVSFKIQSKGVLAKILEEIYLSLRLIFILLIKLGIFLVSYVSSYLFDLLGRQFKTVLVSTIVLILIFIFFV